MKKSIFFVAALLLSSMAFAKEVKLSITIDSIANRDGWTKDPESGSYNPSMMLDDNLTLAVDSIPGVAASGQSGWYYPDENPNTLGTWRIYQARVDSFSITAASGCKIKSVQCRYVNKNNYGMLSWKAGKKLQVTDSIKSDSILTVPDLSVVTLHCATQTNNNAQVRIKKFVIHYDNGISTNMESAAIETKKAQKVLRDGKLYIYNNGKYTNVLGL